MLVNWCNPDAKYSCWYTDKTRLIHTGSTESVDIDSTTAGRVLVLASCRYELPKYQGVKGWYDRRIFACRPGKWHTGGGSSAGSRSNSRPMLYAPTSAVTPTIRLVNG